MSTAARRWLLLFVVLAAIGGGSAVALGATDDDDAPAEAPRPSATASATPTASAAPTPSPAAASSSAGQDPRVTSTEVVETDVSDLPTDERPVAEDGDATVQVSYADWTGSGVEVNAVVLDRVEDGGTCTVTLTRDGETREASAAAFADVTTTICEPLTLAGADLAAGTWRAVVSYDSDRASGTAEAVEVTVP